MLEARCYHAHVLTPVRRRACICVQSLSALAGQRSLLMGMSTKLSDLGAKFPVVNNLVGAIRRKKSKDTIILSAVVATCTLFTIVYWTNK